MKISTFAIVSAILSLLFGIALLFFPAQFVKNFGATLDEYTTILARQYGIAFLCFAIIYWNNRNIPASDKSWLGLLWSNVFFNVTNLILYLNALLGGIGTSFAWSSVVLNVIFIVWSLFFLFRKK